MTQDRSAWMWETAGIAFLAVLLLVSADAFGIGTILSQALLSGLRTATAAGTAVPPIAAHWAGSVRFLLTLVTAGPAIALFLWLILRKRKNFALLFLSAVLVFVFAFALALYTRYGMFCDVSGFVVSLIAGVCGTFIGHWSGEKAQYLQLLRCFHGRLAARQIRSIARHPDRIRTTGECRRITTLICTLHTLPDSRTDPQDFLDSTDEMLPQITAIIHHYGGMMAPETNGFSACWNMPLDDSRHAEHACAAALAIIRTLEARNRLSDKPSIRIGISITTGEGVSGAYQLGSTPVYTMRSYSANRGIRLQIMTSIYGMSILMDDATEALVGKKFAALGIDFRTLPPGKTPIHIFTLLGDLGTRAGPKFRAQQTLHRQIYAAVLKQDWAAARECISHCRKLSGAIPKLYNIYEQRIAYYEKYPLPEGWDGCYRQPLP